MERSKFVIFWFCHVYAEYQNFMRHLTVWNITMENEIREMTIRCSCLGIGSVMPGPHGTTVFNDSI